MEAVDRKTLVPQSTLAQQLKAHVEFLASPELAGREPGTEGNRQAAAYLEAHFQAAGLQPLASLSGYRHVITRALGDNMIGIKRPANPGTNRWILLGAHYDHIGADHLGADDNASSVAILLEIARRLSPLSNYSVMVAAFNAEEPPYFGTPVMGSEAFVAHLPPEIGGTDRLQAVIVMDLMGGVQWEPIRDGMFAIGAEQAPALYQRVKQASKSLTSLSVFPVGMHLVEEIPGHGHEAFSDYDVFRRQGVPFVFLSSARTPRYHTENDLPDTLHYERMATTVEWLQRLLRLIDQDEAPYQFELNRIEFADEVESFRRIVDYATDEYTLIPNTSRLSLRKLRQDAEWLRTVDVTHPTNEDLNRLERISFRFQCLLADYRGCFLF